MRLAQISFLVVATLFLAACGGDRPEPAAKAHAGQLDALRERGQIRIGIKGDSPPFGSMRSGVATGFDVDIAGEVAARIGVPDIAWVPVASAERIDRLLAGDIDVIVASMTMTRSREERVDFSIPYFQDGAALMVPKASAIAGYQDLAGVAVAVIAGSTTAAYLPQVAPDAVVRAYPTSSAMLAAVESGEVQAMALDSVQLQGLRRLAKDPANLRFAGPRFTTEPYAIALRRDQSALRTAINHALLAMWEDGTYQRIHASYFGPGARFHTNLAFAMSPYPK